MFRPLLLLRLTDSAGTTSVWTGLGKVPLALVAQP